MGDDGTSTVYAAELRGIDMALNLPLESTAPWMTRAKNGLVIFADSQAPLKAPRHTYNILERPFKGSPSEPYGTVIQWVGNHLEAVGRPDNIPA
jgi:hypothetical protein